MKRKGYLTESGRVVQRAKRPMDPGQAREGVLWSADTLFETLVADVLFADGRWYVRERGGAEQQWTGVTRGAAVSAAVAGLGLR